MKTIILFCCLLPFYEITEYNQQINDVQEIIPIKKNIKPVQDSGNYISPFPPNCPIGSTPGYFWNGSSLQLTGNCNVQQYYVLPYSYQKEYERLNPPGGFIPNLGKSVQEQNEQRQHNMQRENDRDHRLPYNR